MTQPPRPAGPEPEREPGDEFDWPQPPQPGPSWRRPPPAPWPHPAADPPEAPATVTETAEAEPEPAAAAPEPAPEPAPEAAPPAGPAPALAPALEPAPAGRTAYEVLWDTGLLNVLAVARRDFAALLDSPIAYLVAGLVIVPTSLLGYLLPLWNGQQVTVGGVLGWAAFSMAFLTPLLTERLLAADQRSGRLEQLQSAPVRSWEVVTGKWLAGMAFFGVSMAFTLVDVALVVARSQGGLGDPDLGTIVAGYIGLALVGAAWVALGLLVSSLAPHRLVAAIGGIVLLLAFEYLLGAAAGLVSPPLSDLLQYASASERARSFDQGRLVLRDVVYFVTLAAGALYATAQVVESRRWR